MYSEAIGACVPRKLGHLSRRGEHSNAYKTVTGEPELKALCANLDVGKRMQPIKIDLREIGYE
jgi:hypothetical protein